MEKPTMLSRPSQEKLDLPEVESLVETIRVVTEATAREKNVIPFSLETLVSTLPRTAFGVSLSRVEE